MKHNFYYCERNSLDFLAEPLNFATNFSFLFVSILLLYDKNILDKRYSLLIFLIGIGSMLFHSIPNKLTGFLDIFFIIFFIYYYLVNLYKKLNNNTIFSNLYSIAFIFFCYLFGSFFYNTFLGSSAFYFPILLHLYILFIYFFIKKHQYVSYKKFIWIPLFFTISLILRSIDIKVCNIIPLGTHYIWHIFNAVVLYLLIKFIYLITNRSSPKKPT